MSKKNKVRMGIVGLGRRGPHIMNLCASHPGCEIVGLCDRFIKNAELAAAKLGNPDVKCYSSYEEMLKSMPMDAIFFETPPDIQVEMACIAMEKGLHISTDVPAATSIQQCWDLVKTVEKTGVKYQLAEQTRYWDFIQKWKEMNLKGEFGHIIFAEGEYLHYEEDWDLWVDSMSGEVIRGCSTPPAGRQVEVSWRKKLFAHPIYYLPHTLSPLLSILEDRVTKVSCMGTRPRSYSIENLDSRDMEVALMHTVKDTVLKVSAGFTSPHGHRRETLCHWYQVMGTKATVEWARTENELPKMWTVEKMEWESKDWTTASEDTDEKIKQSGHSGVDWWPIDTFIRAIIDDTPVPMDVYKAVETAAPAILAAESSENGGVLMDVPDFRAKQG